jgi:hypothetical protein
MMSEGLRYDRISQNRAGLPANGGNFAKAEQKVENRRRAVAHRHARQALFPANLGSEQTQVN